MDARQSAPHLATCIDWGVFDAFQIPCSALERRHENLITRAAQAGAGIIIRGGLGADVYAEARRRLDAAGELPKGV